MLLREHESSLPLRIRSRAQFGRGRCLPVLDLIGTSGRPFQNSFRDLPKKKGQRQVIRQRDTLTR